MPQKSQTIREMAKQLHLYLYSDQLSQLLDTPIHGSTVADFRRTLENMLRGINDESYFIRSVEGRIADLAKLKDSLYALVDEIDEWISFDKSQLYDLKARQKQQEIVDAEKA